MPRNHHGTMSLYRMLLFSLLVTVVGCASGTDAYSPIDYSSEDLVAGISLDVDIESVRLPDEHDVLGASAEMREYLDAHVHRTAPVRVRLQQLLDALIDSQEFEVEYETVTRTAADTFHTRKGNCLSYALMFVAMAREAGLQAGFQEVDVPPDWTLRDKSFVLNRHVNAYVSLGSNMRQVIDFNVSEFRTNYQMRRISDDDALAHYYSNIGVDSMHRGDDAMALAAFREALRLGGEYGPAWIHTGLIYKRRGDLDRAEASFLHALESDANDLVAMSNLSDVYDKSGETELAARYRRKVAIHRSQNPYYRFALAQQAVTAQRWDDAIGHLEFAIDRSPEDHRLHYHLGMAQYGKGDLRAAKRSLGRALDIASLPSDIDNYSRKLGALEAVEQ